MFNTILKIVATDPSILPPQLIKEVIFTKPVAPSKLLKTSQVKRDVFFTFRPEKD
jgi:hypothetical protein